MADPINRTAARIAVLIAVPLALLAGFGTFILLNGAAGDATHDPAASDSSPNATAPPVTTPVSTEVRALTEREELVCRALLAMLPGEVGGLTQRPVTAGAEQNAAYGDPAVTVACGTPKADYGPTDQVWPVSGVCWFVEENAEATVLTTLDREVPVSVSVPADYEAPLQQVAGFSGPIVESIRSAAEVPTGCRAP